MNDLEPGVPPFRRTLKGGPGRSLFASLTGNGVPEDEAGESSGPKGTHRSEGQREQCAPGDRPGTVRNFAGPKDGKGE